MFGEEDCYPAQVRCNGSLTCLGIHKDFILRPCYCCGHVGHSLMKVVSNGGVNGISYNCPVSEHKSSFGVKSGKLTCDRSVPLLIPGKFVSFYHNKMAAIVNGWDDYMKHGQGSCLSEDDRVWLRELIRRASCVLRAKRLTNGVLDDSNGTSLTDEADWIWPRNEWLGTDPRTLHVGMNDKISPCGWDDCPEHLDTAVLSNGLTISGCSFVMKKTLGVLAKEKPKPFEYAEHYQFKEGIASMALQRYTMWLSGRHLSEREKFLLRYHVVNICRGVRESWTFTSERRIGNDNTDDISDVESISA